MSAQHADTPQIVHFDPMGRPFLVEDDNNDTSTYKTRTEFDIRGNAVKVTNALDQETVYEYAPVSLAFSTEEGETPIYTDSPDSGYRCMLNNAAGLPMRSWDERGHEIYNEYDELLRPEKTWLGPSGSKKLVNLLEYGEGQGSTNNLKGQLFRQYDQSGRLTNVNFDFKGNLVEMERRLCEDYENLIDWNASPTLRSEDFTTLNTFDAMNRPKTITQADNTEIQYTYNKAGLLEMVKAKLRGAGSATDFVDNIDYNEKGQRTKIEYANNSQTAYTYDPLTFRLKKISTDRDSDGKYLQKIEFFYDAVGNIVYKEDTAHEEIYYDNSVYEPINKYYYDALYRLTKATGRELAGLYASTGPFDPDFVNSIVCPNPGTGVMQNYTQVCTYDAIGNIETMGNTGDWSRTYTYNDVSDVRLDNKLIGITGGTDYTYDEHGNCTEMPHIAELKWDFRDRFKEADLGGGGTAYYTYDANGERVSKVIELSGGQINQTVYLGGYEVYREYLNATDYQNDDRDKERETVHIMDDKRRIALVQTLTIDIGAPVGSPTPVIKYQLDDHLGTACIELDTSANIISFEEYHPFGTTSYRSGSSTAEVSLKKYKYVGKERDDETGLYYYGARYYAAWLCRFMSVDPLKDHYPYYTPYQYAGNKPVTYIDLDGKEEYLVVHFRNNNKLLATAITKIPENLNKGDGKVVYATVDNFDPYVDPKLDSKAFAEHVGNVMHNRTTSIAANIGNTGYMKDVTTATSAQFKPREDAVMQGTKQNFSDFFEAVDLGKSTLYILEPDFSTIHFADDTADLMPEAKDSLNRMAIFFAVFTEAKFTISAHTDDRTSKNFNNNLDLSNARAKAVLDYLVSLGISADKFKLEGHGDTQPIDTNKTPEGQANNRRVELIITEKGYED